MQEPEETVLCCRMLSPRHEWPLRSGTHCGCALEYIAGWLEAVVFHSLAGFSKVDNTETPSLPARLPALYLASSGVCPWAWRSDLIGKLSLNQKPDLSLA